MLDGLDVVWFRTRQVIRALWFLPAIFSLIAILTVTVAYYAAQFTPDKLPFTVESGGVQSILTILASSMLTVSVFALSTIVSAVARASEGTTPRAVPLIVQDRVAQSVISIFVGAFLFSIVGLIGLSSGIYSDAGRLVLFFAAMLVVVIVVAALIRWIGRISGIGRISETIRLVEEATDRSLQALAKQPLYGCALRTDPAHGQAIEAGTVGYVQHFDVSELAAVAEELDRPLHIMTRPGTFVGTDTSLARVEGGCSDEQQRRIRAAFGIGAERTFEYDPGFGFTVLAEVAGKAMSPAINDTGTAISVIAAAVRVLSRTPGGVSRSEEEPSHPGVTVAAADETELLDAVFRPIAWAGAANLEVARRLLEGLAMLARMPAYREPASRIGAEARERALAAMAFHADREVIEALGE